MRVTIFAHDGGVSEETHDEARDWRSWTDYEGQLLERIEIADIAQIGRTTMRLLRIGAGGAFIMHTGPESVFCQVVYGRGRVGLPGDRAISYEGPELLIFEPGAYRDWHGIEEDTLLAVCLVNESESG